MTFFATNMKLGGFIRKQMDPQNTPLTILEIYGRSKTVLKAYGDIAHDLASSHAS